MTPPHIDLHASVDVDRQSLADLATLRLVLTGESLVDIPRLWFGDRDGVDRFLRLNQFDTDNPLDLARLRDLHREAVDYLNDGHRYRILPEVDRYQEIHDLFLLASLGEEEAARQASIVIKVMHILHHISGRELIFSTAISEAELFGRLSARAFTVIDRMRAAGIEVMEFSGGKKSRTSMVTKLLAKRSTIASQIFDKARFSITVREHDSLVPALLFLTHNFFPVNYVVPEQSQNGIITLGDIAKALSLDPQLVWSYWMQEQVATPEDVTQPTPQNEFSGPTYRCINFVVDIPVRIDDVAPDSVPAIAFVQAEVQIFDKTTAEANEQGENAHNQYKKRQYEKVRVRLEGPLGGDKDDVN